MRKDGIEPAKRETIAKELRTHRLATLATLRPDGWPQATTVAYVSDGLTLFVFVSRLGQKFHNITRDRRVSVAIAGDFKAPEEIHGVSLGGRAYEVDDRVIFDRVWEMLQQRFPEYAAWGKPDSPLTVLLRIEPEVISLIDYSKGFGHSELFTLEPGAGRSSGGSTRDWLGRKR
jgi:general stress protein 26